MYCGSLEPQSHFRENFGFICIIMDAIQTELVGKTQIRVEENHPMKH